MPVGKSLFKSHLFNIGKLRIKLRTNRALRAGRQVITVSSLRIYSFEGKNEAAHVLTPAETSRVLLSLIPIHLFPGTPEQLTSEHNPDGHGYTLIKVMGIP